MNAVAMSQTEPSRVTGRKVLLWLVGSFVVVGLVNGLMAYFAISTFTGQTDSHPYAQGLGFNKTLAAVAAQHALGWDVDGTIVDKGGRKVSITATYRDRDGQPIDGLAVRAHFARSTHAGEDFDASLTAQGHGVYTADLPVPAEGEWQVRLSATRDDAAPFLLDYKVFVK
jgi:nitrogen fixation protein FixH